MCFVTNRVPQLEDRTQTREDPNKPNSKKRSAIKTIIHVDSNRGQVRASSLSDCVVQGGPHESS